MLEVLYIEAYVKVKRKRHSYKLDTKGDNMTMETARKLGKNMLRDLEVEYPNWTTYGCKIAYNQYFTRGE